MTAILGISAFYHDSAAALVVDGSIDDIRAKTGRVRYVVSRGPERIERKPLNPRSMQARLARPPTGGRQRC